MEKIKIYSPPILTSKGNIKLGHGANLVWCDTLARVYSEMGFSVNYFSPSWNHQGKMFDYLSDVENSSETLDELESSLGRKTSFFGLEEYTPYRDTDNESKRNSQELFKRLVQKGFIEPSADDVYSLRIDKVKEQTGLVNHITESNFYPKGSKERMLDLIKTLNGAYPITKPRKFATPIPEQEDSQYKINPIFDLAASSLMFSTTPNDYSIDGLKTMLHGTFIPFIIYSGLFDMPFSKNVSVHGFLLPDHQLFVNDLEEFYKKNNSDILRGSSLLCTNSMEDTKLDNTRLKKIIKGTSKLVKLAWFFKNFKSPMENLSIPISPSISGEILSMRHVLAMNNTLERILSLSGELGEKRLTEKDYPRYLSVLNDSRVFFPQTFDKSIGILMKANQED